MSPAFSRRRPTSICSTHWRRRIRACAGGALLLGYLATDKTAARKALHDLHDEDPFVRAYAEASLKRLSAK